MLDFFFLSTRDELEKLTCLCVADCTSGAIASTASPSKGTSEKIASATYIVEFGLHVGEEKLYGESSAALAAEADELADALEGAGAELARI